MYGCSFCHGSSSGVHADQGLSLLSGVVSSLSQRSESLEESVPLLSSSARSYSVRFGSDAPLVSAGSLGDVMAFLASGALQTLGPSHLFIVEEPSRLYLMICPICVRQMGDAFSKFFSDATDSRALFSQQAAHQVRFFSDESEVLPDDALYSHFYCSQKISCCILITMAVLALLAALGYLIFAAIEHKFPFEDQP